MKKRSVSTFIVALLSLAALSNAHAVKRLCTNFCTKYTTYCVQSIRLCNNFGPPPRFCRKWVQVCYQSKMVCLKKNALGECVKQKLVCARKGKVCAKIQRRRFCRTRSWSNHCQKYRYNCKKTEQRCWVERPFRKAFRMWETWNDRGSGAPMDVSFWRTRSRISFGDIAVGKFVRPFRQKLLTGHKLQYIGVLSWRKVWTDKGSGAKKDGSIWQAHCPKGYVTLGMVTTQGFRPPPMNAQACIHRSHVRRSHLTRLIWSDKGSGAKKDVSVWAIAGSPYFYAHASHRKPKPVVWRLK